MLVALCGFSARAAEVEFRGGLEAAADVTLATPGKGVRFPDGSFQVSAKPGYRRTVVAYGAGTAAENGAALLAALAAITGASADDPWLLRLEPGVYDLGNKRLEMKAHVDIEGAGETVTRITGNSDHATLGVVCAGPCTGLRMLTVENTGGGATAIALSTLDVITGIVRVRAIASGAAANIAILNQHLAEPTFSQVQAEARGGTSACGIKNVQANVLLSDVTATASDAATNCAVCSESSAAILRDVTASARGGTANTAVSNDASEVRMVRVTATAVAIRTGNGSHSDMGDTTASATAASDAATAVETRESSAVLRRVQAVAEGPGTCRGILNADDYFVAMYQVNVRAAEGTSAHAIHNDDTPLSLHAVTARASAAPPGAAYGLFVLGADYEVGADSCIFAGTGGSVEKAADVVVRLGACRLEGPVSKVEQTQCAECFDESAFLLDLECQPIL